jgi:hypothetical protein
MRALLHRGMAPNVQHTCNTFRCSTRRSVPSGTLSIRWWNRALAAVLILHRRDHVGVSRLYPRRARSLTHR